jgi:nickel/cobalt exporter
VTGWLGLLALGLMFGVRHALDPDHVIAIATISARTPSVRRSVGVGTAWGLGHTLTILVVGGTMVLFRAVISARAGLAMEFAVAVMLIGLGIANLLSTRRLEPVAPSPLRPFIIGMVHGMAGSAALALLVLATVPDYAAGLLYLLVYGAGTIAGMIGVTTLLTLPMAAVAERTVASCRWLTAASGFASVLFGVLMVHGLGSRWI